MESTPTPIIDIAGLELAPLGHSRSNDSQRLAVARGDVIAILSDSPMVARHLLRILATLERPGQGEYRFHGKRVDLEDYRQCLAVKRQIGYVAPDAAMVSNRTLRENFLLTRFYSENDLTIDIDHTMDSLCRDAGLTQMLNHRPSVLSDGELLKAIVIREMGKAPAVMVIDRPENFMESSENDSIFRHLKTMVRSGTAVVFVSHNSRMNGFANRQLMVSDGAIHLTSRKRPTAGR